MLSQSFPVGKQIEKFFAGLAWNSIAFLLERRYTYTSPKKTHFLHVFSIWYKKMWEGYITFCPYIYKATAGSQKSWKKFLFITSSHLRQARNKWAWIKCIWRFSLPYRLVWGFSYLQLEKKHFEFLQGSEKFQVPGKLTRVPTFNNWRRLCRKSFWMHSCPVRVQRYETCLHTQDI